MSYRVCASRRAALPSATALSRRLRRRRRAAAWMLFAALAAVPAGSQTLTASVIAGSGGRSTSPGGCFRLDATVAQPLAGVASGGSFVITSGFLPGRADRDSIFTYGFEVCS